MRIDLHTDPALRAVPRAPRQSRPWLQLVSAVLAVAGEQAQLLSHTEEPWASVTFTGTRHTVRLQFAGLDGSDAADAFIAALPDHEFAISRRLVADATIAGVEQSWAPAPTMIVEVALLLIDDDL